MQPARTRRRPARQPGPLERLPDLPPIRLPTSAGTLEGFRTWYLSGGRSPHARLSYCGGTILINLGPEQFMVRIPPGATTLEGFRAWALSDDFPRQGHISFLGKEIYIDMSPEETETHNKVKTAVTSRLFFLCEELDLGELYSDRTAVTNARGDLSTEPDATFVSWETSETGHVRLVPRRDARGQFIELQGTPDWVLEVVSRNSMHKDTVELRDRYFRAGIPEYWLIDAMGEDVVFQILTRRRSGYAAVRPRGGWHKSRVFPASFRLERQRNRVGRWKYQLLVQRS